MRLSSYNTEIQPTGYKRILADLLGVHSTKCYRPDHLLEGLKYLFSLIDALESSQSHQSEHIQTQTSDVKRILRTLIKHVEHDPLSTQNGHKVLHELYKILGHISTITRDSEIDAAIMWKIEGSAVHCIDIAQNSKFNTITGPDATYHEQTVSFAERAADILLCVCFCASMISNDESNKKEISASLARIKHAIGLSSIISTNTPFIYRQDATFLTRFHTKSAFEQLKKYVPSEKRHSLSMIERTVNFYYTALDYYSDLRLYEPAMATGNRGHFAIALNIFEAILLTGTLIKKFGRQEELKVLLHIHLMPAKKSLERAFDKCIAAQNNSSYEPNYDSVHTHLDDARVKLENIYERNIDTNIIAIVDKVITGVSRTIDIIDGDIPVHSSIWDRTKTPLPLFPFETPVILPTVENMHGSRRDVTHSYASLLNRQTTRAAIAEEQRMLEQTKKQSFPVENSSDISRKKHDLSLDNRGHHPFAVGAPYSISSQEPHGRQEKLAVTEDMPKSHSASVVPEQDKEKPYAVRHRMNSQNPGGDHDLHTVEHETKKSAHTKKGGILSTIKNAFTAIFDVILGILKTICCTIKNLFFCGITSDITSSMRCSFSGSAEKPSSHAKRRTGHVEKEKSEAMPQTNDQPSHKLVQNVVEKQCFSKTSLQTR